MLIYGDRPPGVEDNPGNRYRQMLGGQERPRAHSRYNHVKRITRGSGEGGALGVSTMNRIRNREIQKKCGNKSNLKERVDQYFLQSFGHI